ncbi:Mannan endo-1,6-alpha-mannosidase DCW1 [Beauveria bassiana]|uniref:Mannan endo-1,6-alpha-mannosidase n=1 Tax=Beauveria bassiana (strain ARSEF 2860) TaxID=655819 RepID=J4KPI8_BEAB2|nr:glycoside hydrolase family 76 [Beauveria bassiana ARSEF 2860]EJP67529.1 glycoside hydrolase family 76 [Beauveria bassiana ARSEF 2860]KAF1734177.1 Mannan endo-1,6-alpha-mannosidase DCW1 [Beauveria bassiana]KAH8709327.1 Mannan endo-1,6-alpha-mannosidase DCW1 [Beauveria bassiana]
MKTLTTAAAATALLSLASGQNTYSIDSDDAIKKTASQMAEDLLKHYHGDEPGQVPGILPGPPPAGPYYWWIGGAMWGTLIDYWHLTGDTTYNDRIMQAMQFQVGENKAYMPNNYTASLGNDDQGFWGMSAMLAAEVKFPDPPSDKPSWLALAQAVWNTQASPSRHDTECNGGLRWQIPFANNGFDYKNSIANGIFFNMGARLGRYTGNQTYIDWAEKTFDWVTGVGYIDPQTHAIYDGGHVEHNCTDINKVEFSYNNAVFLQGCAYMYNHTDGAQKWKNCVDGLVKHGLEHFFPKEDIAYEPACEGVKTCTTDMLSFKGYLHRWWSASAQMAPYIADQVLPVLRKSAAACVKQCTGGEGGRQCGFYWQSGAWQAPDPPNSGASQQMNAVAAVSALLYPNAKPAVTADTGGTSKSDPNAGVGQANAYHKDPKPITTADRAGAGIITFVLLSASLGMFGWMSVGI